MYIAGSRRVYGLFNTELSTWVHQQDGSESKPRAVMPPPVVLQPVVQLPPPPPPPPEPPKPKVLDMHAIIEAEILRKHEAEIARIVEERVCLVATFRCQARLCARV